MSLREAQVDDWKENQKDPDNWLVIPEFGVLPQSVGFIGFAYPIVAPSGDPMGHLRWIRDMVRIARAHARESFASLAEMQRVNSEAWDKRDTDSLNSRERAAIYHQFLMRSFKLAVTQSRGADSWRVAENIAEGASILANWLVDRPLGHLPYEVIERMRRGAIAGGQASAATRRAASKIPSAEVLKQERDLLLEGGRSSRDIAGILATRYSCTSDYIRKALKRE